MTETRIFEGEGGVLRDKTIFLSASKPSRELEWFPPAGEAEMEEAVRSLARAVFAEGGHLVFGAHPSISPLVVDVATEYFPARWEGGGEPAPPVTIYQSEAFSDVIPFATRELERLGYARIIWTEARNGEVYDPGPPPREQCLASLAHMRERMFAETNPLAMVAAGGMQGVIREARLFLEMFRGPVYVLNSSSGAAARLIPYLADNVLRDGRPITVDGWRNRLIRIEEHFAVPDWETLRASHTAVPSQPFALLMQKMVQEIAGRNKG